jgi:DNA polymerase-3 subunit alpha
MGCEFHLVWLLKSNELLMPVLDTCTEVTARLLQLPGGRGGRFKLILTELHRIYKTILGKRTMRPADVEATTRCFLEQYVGKLLRS